MTTEFIATAAMVLLAAVFFFWVRRVTRVKRRISHKPIQSTTTVGMYDHHGRYYEIEVQTGLIKPFEKWVEKMTPRDRMILRNPLVPPDLPGLAWTRVGRELWVGIKEPRPEAASAKPAVPAP